MNTRFPFAHTFSIVARDALSGDIGAAVQSHWFSTGSMVTWAEAGVGAVATQSMVEVSYGPLGLEQMRSGHSAPEALQKLLAADEGCVLRQVAMVDAAGHAAAHTGARCIAEAGHQAGEGFSCQANMMLTPDVWPGMARAYQGAGGALAERLLAALDAGQAAGGDIRGVQSAAILVVSGKKQDHPWEGKLVDLRVDDHPDPLGELRRLLTLQTAYGWMNEGDQRLGEGKMDEALELYRAAANLYPAQEEFPFWHAVTLADLGRVEEALPLFRQVFRANPHYAELLRRLPAAGLLCDDAEMMKKLLSRLD